MMSRLASGPTAPRRRRLGSKQMVIAAAAVGATLFVLWDADWWELRDRIEHIKTALIGPYVTPECRRDPNGCQNSRPAPFAPRMAPMSSADVCRDAPGLRMHCELQALFRDLNNALFGGRLPPAVITLQRDDPRAGGYFAHGRYKRPNGTQIDEIAINLSRLKGASMRYIASVVLHEMVHLEVAHFGTSGRKGFHNEDWGRRMRRVGLQPSATGKPGGATTGVNMSHYVITGGHFDRLAQTHLLIAGRKVSLVERYTSSGSKGEKR
jgi:predicted SprT family Zn-dependent metalloprotease